MLDIVELTGLIGYFSSPGIYHVPQNNYKVLPGDSFRATCYYKNGTKFGLSAMNEMCVSYILYYPAKQTSSGLAWQCLHAQQWGDALSGCAAELEYSNLNGIDDLGRNFGVSGQCAPNQEVIKPAMGELGQT